MKTRTDILNHLAEKHGLDRYLEIGVQDPTQNFDKIICRQKVGVDPHIRQHGFIQETSDNFFRNLFEREKKEAKSDASMFIVELVFIDGLHTAEQVRKDFENALKILAPGGFIVLHDCNPEKEEHTIVPRPTERGHWNGDVYKFATSMPKYPFWTVDIDNGCMVIKPEKDCKRDWPTSIDWQTFDKNRKEYLNLITWDEFVNL